jgi:riboflavin biosynthesis pyrimidine reductase
VALGGCLLRGRLDAGLIDEFHLYVNPTVLGHGKSIWSRGTSPMAPQTGILQVHDCGVVVQKYVPIRPAGRTS